MVYADEVMDLLAMVGRGKITPALVVPGDSLETVGHGNVEFLAGWYHIVVYADDGEFDYVDSISTPGGEHGEFDDWATNPAEMLVSVDPALFARAEQAFLDAR